ncbi:threonine efflux protein [Actinobacillus equuli]|nr:threonine efflux protein [Actinobacillus equuli]
MAIWAVVAVFGLSVLSQTTHIIQYIIMILGGSFLAYMGVKMVQVTQNAKFDESKAKVVQTTIRQEILKALSVNIANAKIAVFFSSVLSGYVAQLSNITDLLAVLMILVGSAFVYFY